MERDIRRELAVRYNNGSREGLNGLNSRFRDEKLRSSFACFAVYRRSTRRSKINFSVEERVARFSF